MADHAGESDWLALCDCQWPLALCQWASGFGGAGLRGPPPSESSGVVFLLVGVPALCLVHLCVPVHWRWRRQPAVRFGGSEDHRIRRRRRRHWRRSVGRRRLGFQRGCVAARFLGQRLPRLLQRWWDCPCHWVWYGFAPRRESRVGHHCPSQPACRWWLKNCPWQSVLQVVVECAPPLSARWRLVPGSWQLSCSPQRWQSLPRSTDLPSTVHGSLLRSAARSCTAVARASTGLGGAGLVGAPPGSSGRYSPARTPWLSWLPTDVAGA